MNAKEMQEKLKAYCASEEGRQAFAKARAEVEATVAMLNEARKVTWEDLNRQFTI